MPAADRSHYAGSYQMRALAVRRSAYADSSTVCWNCGLTLAQKARQIGRRVRWHAGHTVDGDSSAPLLAEHDVCNTSAGATAGNRKRARAVTVMPKSQEWY